MRKKRFAFYFGTVMSTVMLLFSCNKAIIVKNGAGKSSAIEQNQVSGEEWFKSVFFADGVMASKIEAVKELTPENRGMTTKELSVYREFEQKLISELTKRDAGYFQDFKKAMESEDPYLIEQTLEDAKPLIYKAAKKIVAAEGYDLDQEMQNYMSNQNGPVAKSVAIVFIVTVVIALAIAVNLTVTYTKTSSAYDSGSGPIYALGTEGGTLTSEMFASQIATIE